MINGDQAVTMTVLLGFPSFGTHALRSARLYDFAIVFFLGLLWIFLMAFSVKLLWAKKKHGRCS